LTDDPGAGLQSAAPWPTACICPLASSACARTRGPRLAAA